MPWPAPQDYQEALQNPRLAFNDRELQVARPKENPLGLPQPICGTFASVYRMESPSGQTWAVRCFLREFGDQQQRYDAISRELARLKLPYTVVFEYQPRGIRVKENWFPILKMEWVRGESLNRYVGSRLGKPSLRELAEKILVMARRMADAGIAHGDLQDGNILVVGGEPRLIDYDGMFVPALAGWKSHELGQQNFQHPDRRADTFGPGLDNFSVWVIYLSLIALSTDGRLWDRHQGGDQCLVFRREDFERPEQSRLFKELESSTDPLVQGLTYAFRPVLTLDPNQVPFLDRSGHPPSPPSVPIWLQDHISTSSKAGTADLVLNKTISNSSTATFTHTAGDHSPVVDLSWLAETWEQTGDELRFQIAPWPDRISWAIAFIVSLISLISSADGMPIWIGATMSLAANVVAITVMLTRFSADPARQQLLRFARQLPVAEQEAAEAVNAVRLLETELNKRLADLESRVDKYQERIKALEAEERDAIAAIIRVRTDTIARLQRERDLAKQRLDNELRGVSDQIASHLTEHDRQLANLPNDELIARNNLPRQQQLTAINAYLAALTAEQKNERNMLLKQKQAEHLRSAMQGARLMYAGLTGFGKKLKANLCQSGFHSAADIDHRVFKVADIGNKRGQLLLQWRDEIKARADRTMPTTLTADEEKAISQRTESRRAELMANKRATEQGLVSDYQALRERFESRRVALLELKEQAQKRLRLEEHGARVKFNQIIADLAKEETDADRVAQAKSESARNQFQIAIEEAKRKLDQIEKERQSPELAESRRLYAEARQATISANWKTAKFRHQLATHRKNLTIWTYIKRVLWLN